MVISRELVVEPGALISDDAGRLDMFLARHAGLGLTRSQVVRLVDEGQILLNGAIPKASRRLRSGDCISVTVPPPRPVDLAPEEIPLNIVYQDGELLVVDKPAGLTVHPAPGHPSHTLVNALLALCPDLKGIGGELRPGIVHRLDKDTSGLMVVAKSSDAHLGLTNQIKERTLHKGYLALSRGKVEPAEGIIEAPIGRDPRNRKRMAVVQRGRNARTTYMVRQYYGKHSLIDVFPETGRTHQIRVHFASMGHPLVGDAVYGGGSSLLGRQFLHANLLGFRHPITDEYLEFTSPLPGDLCAVIEALEAGKM